MTERPRARVCVCVYMYGLPGARGRAGSLGVRIMHSGQVLGAFVQGKLGSITLHYTHLAGGGKYVLIHPLLHTPPPPSLADGHADDTHGLK